MLFRSPLLKELDKPAEFARVTEFVALKHAEPGKVREALQYFYGPDAVDAETLPLRTVIGESAQALVRLRTESTTGEFKAAIIDKTGLAPFQGRRPRGPGRG